MPYYQGLRASLSPVPWLSPVASTGARSHRPWPSCQGSRSDRLRLGLDSADAARTIVHRGDGATLNHRPQPATASKPASLGASRPGAQDAQRPSTGSNAAALSHYLIGATPAPGQEQDSRQVRLETIA
jgi:hypothetical protein